MENENKKNKPSKLKIIYACALLMALGGALLAKITTEKSLGNISVPIENNYITVTEEKTAEQVRNNLTNVPDTRVETKVFVKETTTEKKKVTTTEAVSFAKPYSDYYSLPLSKDIIKDYSDNIPVYSETMKDWRVHNAVDFKGEAGSAVKAISEGTVTDVKTDVLWGTAVTVDHGNGVIARYCGFNSDTVEVKAGKKVTAGTVLGYLGTVPCEKADGPHLHFEIIYKNKTVEPLELMGK